MENQKNIGDVKTRGFMSLVGKILIIITSIIITLMIAGYFALNIHAKYFSHSLTELTKDGLVVTDEWLTIPQQEPLVTDFIFNDFCINIPRHYQVDVVYRGIIFSKMTVVKPEIMMVIDGNEELFDISGDAENFIGFKENFFCKSFSARNMTITKIKIRSHGGRFFSKTMIWYATDKK